MRTNLKVLLSAVGVAAALTSPVMAKTVRHHVAPSTVYIPSDARASVAPYGTREGGPYTPSSRAPAYGVNPDFQNGNPN
jgi:hypothetical protein